MRVTNGTVSYSRVRKDDDFGIKRDASASFSFTLDDDEDASEHAANLLDIAVDRVHKAIRIEGGKSVAVEVAKKEIEAKVVQDENFKGKTDTPKTKAPRAPKAPKTEKVTVEEVDDIFGDETKAVDNGLGDLLDEAPAEVVKITDQELVALVDAKNKKLNKPQLIRELITQYTGGPPKVIRDIAADKRGEFVAKLEALK